MIIRKIQATGLKGLKFDIPLTVCSAIVGPNSAGKTAVLDAIKLALLGHVPGIEKTNAGIYQFHGGDAPGLLVLAETSEGQQHERAFTRNAKTGAIQRSDRLSQTLPPFPLVVLDANDFLGRTDTKRMEVIFSLMGNNKATPSDKIAAMEAQLRASGNDVGAEFLKRLTPVVSEGLERWLERALQAAGERKREATALVTSMTKTQQSLAALQLDDPAALDTEIHNIDTDLKAAREVLEQRRTAYAELDAQQKEQSTRAQRRLLLRQRQSKLAAAAQLPGDFTGNLEAAKAELAGIRAIHEQNTVAAANDAYSAALEKVATFKAKVTNAQDSLKALVARKTEVLAHKECPTCHTNKPTWKRDAEKQFAKEEKDFADAITAYEKALATAGEEFEAANKACNQAEERFKRASELERSIEKDEAASERAGQAATDLEEVVKELAELGNGVEGDEAEKIAYAAQCELQDAQQLVSDLEARKDKAGEILNDRKRLQQAKDQADEGAHAAACFAKLIVFLQEKRGQFIQEGIKPILDVANHFANGILPSKLEYDNGAIGRRDEKGRWIASETFSGAEQLATHAALSAALGSQAPLRLIIIDEMGRFDPQAKKRFMENALVALHGPNGDGKDALIDQLIVADVLPDCYQEINQEGKRVTIIPIGQSQPSAGGLH